MEDLPRFPSDFVVVADSIAQRRDRIVESARVR
jgi:hypothetical protein